LLFYACYFLLLFYILTPFRPYLKLLFFKSVYYLYIAKAFVFLFAYFSNSFVLLLFKTYVSLLFILFYKLVSLPFDVLVSLFFYLVVPLNYSYLFLL